MNESVPSRSARRPAVQAAVARRSRGGGGPGPALDPSRPARHPLAPERSLAAAASAAPRPHAARARGSANGREPMLRRIAAWLRFHQRPRRTACAGAVGASAVRSRSAPPRRRPSSAPPPTDCSRRRRAPAAAAPRPSGSGRRARAHGWRAPGRSWGRRPGHRRRTGARSLQAAAALRSAARSSSKRNAISLSLKAGGTGRLSALPPARSSSSRYRAKRPASWIDNDEDAGRRPQRRPARRRRGAHRHRRSRSAPIPVQHPRMPEHRVVE